MAMDFAVVVVGGGSGSAINLYFIINLVIRNMKSFFKEKFKRLNNIQLIAMSNNKNKKFFF
jgi:hypothetical protein